MNRYRNVPGLRAPTKAAADTLCQKCLKRDSYECKASAQERPYISRPSRTQQLLNPDLRPKLTTEVPNDLLRTKGVADELLKKKDEERGRKRDIDDLDGLPDGRGESRKRARSLSSYSSSSISTISTNRSRSVSRERRPRYDAGGSRTRSPRRTPSVSPQESRRRKRRYSDASSGYSHSSPSSVGRSRSRNRDQERNIRRRRGSSSPEERGRSSEVSRRGIPRDRSRRDSLDKSRIAKARRSLTPENLPAPGHERDRQRPRGRSPQLSGGRYGGQNGRHRTEAPAPAPPRERSLSPFSKRLALTQAMNMGR